MECSGTQLLRMRRGLTQQSIVRVSLIAKKDPFPETWQEVAMPNSGIAGSRFRELSVAGEQISESRTASA